MRTAVVILNWNGREWLQRFLPGVIANTPDAEVIVADNGSTDDSLAWLAATYPALRTLPLDGNHGFAGGYDRALAQVTADRYVLLNSDVEVTPGWIAALNAYLDSQPGMVACQPKVLSYRDRNRFEHAGAAGGYIDRNGYPFCRGRIFEITEPDTGQYDSDTDVFWATGACLMIDAQAFHAVGCWLLEKAFKFIPGPLKSVFDGIGKVFQGTNGDGFLWWILARAVGFCQEGDYHLHVALCAQCARL